MAHKLDNKTIAILVTNGFEQAELKQPMQALRNHGAKAVLVSPETGEVKAWQQDHWGDSFNVGAKMVEEFCEGEHDEQTVPRWRVRQPATSIARPRA
jgi:protease I